MELTRAFRRAWRSSGRATTRWRCRSREHALRRAKDVDDDIKRERFRSPLQGIPFGAKDLLSLAGQPDHLGRAALRRPGLRLHRHGAREARQGRRHPDRQAGHGGTGRRPGYRYARASLTGPGLNPWDRTRWSGGSSSGSGIAVAAGLVPFALGSETSGSILTPSAFCGVTGLRPTYGLVSRHGAMALSWTLDKIGPMCRSAEDCALVLQAIAGGDGNDPGSAGKSFYYTAAVRHAR